MPTPCQKSRCPARDDVSDWTTTEYRKSCRETPCRRAHTLAEQRRKAKKVEEAAAVVGPTVGVPDGDDESAEELVDLVKLIREDLQKLGSDHPLKDSYAGIALSLAREIQVRSLVPAMSSAGAAKQLVDVLERLKPANKGSLEEELARLFADDDDDEPARAE